MARCYLMIEDIETEDGDAVQFQYAADFGIPHEDLPERVEDMTPAQEMIWSFYNIARAAHDDQHRAEMQREVRSQIVMPEHIADES
jgi:hypothetical protein